MPRDTRLTSLLLERSTRALLVEMKRASDDSLSMGRIVDEAVESLARRRLGKKETEKIIARTKAEAKSTGR